MSTALESIVREIFDYAGLFPPASLDWEAALKNSAGFPTTLTRPHLVAADFVCSVTKLPELSAASLLELGFGESRIIDICSLGSEWNPNEGTISESRQAELQTITDFRDVPVGQKPRRRVISYEFALPGDLQPHENHLSVSLRNIKSFLREESLIIFLEPNLAAETWLEDLQLLSELMGNLNQHCQGPAVGLKIRCSGPKATPMTAIPAVFDILEFSGFHFKATAGLHHPIVEPERYQNNMGFLTLALAVYFRLLLGSEIFSRESLLELLQLKDAATLHFDENARWRDFSVTAEQIDQLRDRWHFSIGSCSLSEPDADLKRLFGA